ncbi:MAG: hypothetical protein Fur005_17990 [Roseiflexaceae bacterium]
MMLEYLASYVPAATLRRLSSDPRPPSGPVAQPCTATILFADISGFTALAERLAQRGPIGAEDLTRALNTVFDLLIDLVDAHGGEVVKFAGDALLAIWPTTSAGLAETTLLATQVSLAMHERLAALQRLIIQAPLTLKVGIGVGDVVIASIGGERQRWDTLLTGAPLAQVKAAEAQARPGQVVLSREAWRLVADRCHGEARPQGMWLIEAVHTPLPPRQAIHTPIPAAAEVALRSFIPGAVLSQLSDAQAGWIGDLRRISVLFINLPGLESDLERQQAIMCAAQVALYRYEGSINKLSVDDKGVTLVAALGLPPLAHEDDAVRAVQAAMQIQRSVEELGSTCTIGIASGRVFCGAVGNDLRREYTMIGDVVNLAARLMQAAGSLERAVGAAEVSMPIAAIICDEATAHAARGHVDFETLTPILVKGKALPVAVFRPMLRPTAPSRHTRPRVEVIGRANELMAMRSALDLVLRNGQSQVILLEGDAGMGKSWLIADLIREAGSRRMSIFSGGGDALEQSTPYYAWRAIFSQLYDIDVLSDQSARRRHMLDLLELEPDLLNWAPLLNTVLPLDLPDNEQTRALTDSTRAEQTRTLLVGCIRASIERSPKILVLDDMHWADSASWALAEQIAYQVPRLLIIIAARPSAEPYVQQGMQALRPLAHLAVRLDSLSHADLRQLVASRLGVQHVAEAVIELIWEKAQGNPFFSTELAYALRDSGLLQIEADACLIAPDAGDLRTLSLPDTLQGVITSRFDRLTPAQQLTLKTASVIGFVFPERALHAIYPLDHERAALVDCLQALEQQDMTLPEPLEYEVAYRFKHAITKEVVYDLMLFAQRRALHRSLALWYERLYANDLERYFQLLAHHWDRAGDLQRSLDYLDRAARHSLSLCAYQEARNLLIQAVDLAEQIDPPQPERMLRLRYALGETCWFQGEADLAQQHFEAALAAARALRDQSQTARVLSRLAQIHQDRGEVALAEQLLGESQELAIRIGDQEVLVGVYRNLGNIAMLRSQFEQAHGYWSRSLEMARGIDDDVGIARALGNQGWGAYLQQEYHQARLLLRAGLTAVSRAGDQWVMVDIMTSLGLVLCDDPDTHDLAEAQAVLLHSLRIALRIGVATRTLYTLAALARWRECGHQIEAAVELATFVSQHPAGGGDTALISAGVLERCRLQLAADTYERAVERGRLLSIELITQALPRE